MITYSRHVSCFKWLSANEISFPISSCINYGIQLHEHTLQAKHGSHELVVVISLSDFCLLDVCASIAVIVNLVWVCHVKFASHLIGMTVELESGQIFGFQSQS